jgi:uncharacterized protein (DUF924 family)
MKYLKTTGHIFITDKRLNLFAISIIKIRVMKKHNPYSFLFCYLIIHALTDQKSSLQLSDK